MTRDLPSDADAGDAGDHAGDTAYRVATGVARVARAGAFVTGGALIASGGGTPTAPHSEDESQIAGWSVKDPQPNAPSPVVTYPDPSPDSTPPGPGHQAPSGPQDGPPGLYFHFQINPGPNGDDHVPGMPDLNRIPGMNGIPGTDGGTPGMNMVPNTDSAPGIPQGGGHLPGLGNGIPGLPNGIPGFGNGVPGLGNGIPGFGNGIPGVGNTPGLHIPGLPSGNGGADLGLPGMHPAAASIAADGSPGAGFSPDAVLTSLVHPADMGPGPDAAAGGPSGFGPIDLGDNSGDGSDFGQVGPEGAVPQAFSGGTLPGFHLPGEYGFEGAGFGPDTGFDGVGSDFGVFFDASTDLDAHVGLDGVWLTVDTTVHVGVGDIGQELDNYGNYGGWPGAQLGPGGMPGTESALVPGMNSGLLGAQPGPVAVPTVFGAAPGAAGTSAPVSGVVLPGTSPTSVPGIAGVPGTGAAPSIAPALPAAAPVLGAALPAVSPTPVLASAPAVAVAMPQPVPAPAVTAPAIAIAQPVVATPLQPAAHPDVATHPLVAALPEHGLAFPLAIGATAVSSAGFLGIPRHTAPSSGPGASPGEHSTPTATPIATPGAETTAPAIPHISIAPVPVSGAETPGHTAGPTHPIGPAPIDESGSPTTGAHTGADGSTATDSTTAAHPGTHGSTDSDGPTTPTHPSTADDSTTHAHPGATNPDGTTPAHPTQTGADGSTAPAHPGSTGAADSTTAPHAADSTAPVPGHDSTQPSRDHDSSPSHDSTPSHDSSPSHDSLPTYDSGPSHDSPPSHNPAPTYDSPPTRDSLPTHGSVPTVDSPREPSVPGSMPSMPTHEAPPPVPVPSIPGEGGGQLPGAHLAPHAPILPPTFELGAPNPMKPIAHVMNSNDPTPWDDASHAGLSAVPASLLSGGLIPGSELYPSHLPVHAVPDPHIAL